MRVTKTQLIACLALFLVAAPALAQSSRAYESANEHARFQRLTTLQQTAPVAVPEPASGILLALGVGAVALRRLKKK